MNYLSSSNLLSNQLLTIDNINSVINATRLGLFGNNHFSLFPSLNVSHLNLAYQDIINEPNETVHLVNQTSSTKMYFCKMNDVVYEVIIDNFTNIVLRVKIVVPFNID